MLLRDEESRVNNVDAFVFWLCSRTGKAAKFGCKHENICRKRTEKGYTPKLYFPANNTTRVDSTVYTDKLRTGSARSH